MHRHVPEQRETVEVRGQRVHPARVRHAGPVGVEPAAAAAAAGGVGAAAATAAATLAATAAAAAAAASAVVGGGGATVGVGVLGTVTFLWGRRVPKYKKAKEGGPCAQIMLACAYPTLEEARFCRGYPREG